MLRGRTQEEGILAQLEAMPVVATQALHFDTFVIRGRVDGIQEDGTIVEVKTRRNWFREPPAYDLVQLQVYLRLYGRESGLLVERSQSDPNLSRSTQVRPEADDWWRDLTEALAAAAEEIRGATLERAAAWARTFD